MNVYETLRMAVLSKKPCKISVLGEPERKVCPYLISKSNKGEEYVLYYQYGGYSSSGLEEDGSSANWRCSRVSDITSAEIVDESCASQFRNRKRGVAALCLSTPKLRATTKIWFYQGICSERKHRSMPNVQYINRFFFIKHSKKKAISAAIARAEE